MSTGGRAVWRTVVAELRANGVPRVEIARVLRERFNLGALAAMRHAHGWSQGQVAHEWCLRWPRQPKTYKDISGWETGERTPLLGTFDRLAQLYRCDLADLLADRPGYRPDDEGDEDVATKQRRGPSSSPGGGSDMERRDLIAGLGSSVAAATVGQLVFHGPKDVPPELATYFADQFAHHTAATTRLGGRPLINTMTSEYQTIRQAAEAVRPNQASELHELSVAYADLVGWAYQDVGDFDASWQWRSRALELAHRSGDTNLVAYALTDMALLRREADDDLACLELTRAALHSPGLPPTISTFALRQLAHACALAGDRDGVDRALDAAADSAEQATSDERYRWGGPWWSGTQDGHRAYAYARLGASSDAADLLERALAQYPTGAHRWRGGLLARYAMAVLDVDGPEAAVAPAAEAVNCLHRLGSAVMGRELRRLRDRATARTEERGGQDLVEVLRLAS